MTFEEFQRLALEHGLVAQRNGNHWDLRGHAPLFVEFWPDKNRVRRNQQYVKPVPGTPDDAIKAALELQERPAATRHNPQHATRLEALERIVKLAAEYIGGDERRLCDMTGERMLAALELMRALADGGFVAFDREHPF